MRSRRDVLEDAKRGVIDDPPGPRTRRTTRRTRRAFITVSVAATGGLLVAMRSDALGAQMQQTAQSGPLAFPTDYVQIDPDDRVLRWDLRMPGAQRRVALLGDDEREVQPVVIREVQHRFLAARRVPRAGEALHPQAGVL